MKKVLQLNKGARYFFYTLIFLLFSNGYWQEYSVGIKAGLNYSLNEAGSKISGNEHFSAESGFGYVAGVF